jgi:hypothetical protein
MKKTPRNTGEDWVDPDLFRMSTSSVGDLMDEDRLAHREPSSHRRPTKGGKQNAASRTSSQQTTHRQAVLEIPLSLSEEEGFSLTKKTRLAVSSNFFVSGPFRAGLGASTHMRGRTGYSSGNGSLLYSVGSLGSNVRGAVTIGESSPQIRVGGTYNPTVKSSVAATLQTRLPRMNPNADDLVQSQPRLSLSLRHNIDPRVAFHTSCVVDPSPSRKNNANMFQVNMQSRTVHRWNLGFGWNPSLHRPSLSLQLTSQLFSPHRLLSLSASWRAGQEGRPMNWSLGGTLIQQSDSSAAPGSNSTTTRVGVGLSDGKSLAWIFSWKQGDFTLRVPIELSSVCASATNLYWYPVQVLYFSFLSKIIQDVVADVLKVSTDLSDPKILEQQRHLDREKSRQDAAQQQQFMERQAKSRTAAEEKRGGDGLVIRKAVYHVDGGDRWEVTIALQFWVSDSCLELPASSKRGMLGFYDVTTSVSTESHSKSSLLSKQRPQDSWWRGFWTLRQSSASNDKGKSLPATVSAKLSVQYDFAAQSYEITVHDHEELVLPNPRAMVIIKPEEQ